MPYYQYCSLIVDDIPIKSIVNPPTAMKGKDESPGYVGHNSMKPSIQFFEFKLTGVVSLRMIGIEPSFYKFPNPLLIGKQYMKEFKIKNFSNGVCTFTIEQKKRNADDFEIDINPVQVLSIFL